MKNKNIMFIIPSMGKGGAERVISILSNYYSKDNYVSIITFTNVECMYELDDEVNYINLAKNTLVAKNHLIKKMLIIPKFIKRYYNMKKTINHINPDIIISFLPSACYLTKFVKNRKSKWIISDRNDPKREYDNKLDYFLMKHTYPKADGFIFQTEEAKLYFNNLIDFSKKDYKIIVNPVNPKVFSKIYLGERENRIVTVARLEKQKNLDFLIKSFSEFCKECSDYVLEIYGDGSLKNQLKELIRKLDVEDKIKLMGQSDDVFEDITRAKIFVLVSEYEGIPNSLLEAMCMGIPVISSDCPCGGPKHFIIDGENGFLFQVNNKIDFLNKLNILANNESLLKKFSDNCKNIKNEVKVEFVIKSWDDFLIKEMGIENEKN